MKTLKLALSVAVVLFAAVAAQIAVSAPAAGEKESVGAATDAEKGFAKELLKATADVNFEAFIAHGDDEFKTLDKKDFIAVCDQIKGHLKAGYHLVFLGGLKKDGYHATVWKVTYDDNTEDDLMELEVKDGKIVGASIH